MNSSKFCTSEQYLTSQWIQHMRVSQILLPFTCAELHLSLHSGLRGIAHQGKVLLSMTKVSQSGS